MKVSHEWIFLYQQLSHITNKSWSGFLCMRVNVSDKIPDDFIPHFQIIQSLNMAVTILGFHFVGIVNSLPTNAAAGIADKVSKGLAGDEGELNCD